MTKTLFRIRSIQILAIFLVFVSCKKDSLFTHLEGNALGTTFSIKYNASINYSEAVDSLFTVINSSLSTYHSNSIISKINQGDTTQIVDMHFEKVFQKADRIYLETNGAFDPTVGSLVNAWGFGPENAIENLDSIAVKEIMKGVGFHKLRLENLKLQKENEAVYLDFNAIAKGYAVDVIGLFFENKGIMNYMVEIGGEMRVRGHNPSGNLWTVGIEKPLTDGSRALETTRSLDNQSMATSGNYRKFRIDENGKKYVHTINPKTGYTEQNDLLSASVIATVDCADVDAYATAFMVMGFQETKEFLSNHPELQAILIYLDLESNIQVYDSNSPEN